MKNTGLCSHHFLILKDRDMLTVGYLKRNFLKSLRIFSNPGLGDLCCIIHLVFQELICCSGNFSCEFCPDTANVILVSMFGHV